MLVRCIFLLFPLSSISALVNPTHLQSPRKTAAALSASHSLLQARKKDDSSFSNSIVPFLSGRDDTSAATFSFNALLVLSDSKRQAAWKDDIKKDFPFVPAVFVDIFCDSVISAFAATAPSELQMVAQPGGFEKVRSKMDSAIKKSLKRNEIYAGLPMSNKDKDNLLSALIGASLDLLLRDAAAVLVNPNEKLLTLEDKKRQITRFMTKRQLIWYQVRYHTVRSTMIVAVGTFLLKVLYDDYQSAAIVRAIEKSVTKVWVFAKSLILGLVGSSSRSKRRAVRRRVR